MQALIVEDKEGDTLILSFQDVCLATGPILVLLVLREILNATYKNETVSPF